MAILRVVHLVAAIIIAMGTTPVYAADNGNRAKMEELRLKLQKDVQQMKVDQQKLTQDREVVRQDRMEMMRMRQDMMRERMDHKMDTNKKLKVENQQHPSTAPSSESSANPSNPT